MAVITLTTDWGVQDYYAGMLKGYLIQHLPDAQIIDITHQIRPFDIPTAAFQVRAVLQAFPANTIHIALVNAFEQNAICAAVSLYDQWIIVPDNRMASMIMCQNVCAGLTFAEPPNLPYFQQVAILAKLIASQKFDNLKTVELLPAQWLYPIISDQCMKGLFIHIDHFGNCITNIHKKEFYHELKNRKFELSFRSIRIRELHEHFFEVDKGDAIAYFGNSGFLEIGMREASAGTLLGIKPYDQLTIEFFE